MTHMNGGKWMSIAHEIATMVEDAKNDMLRGTIYY